MIRVAYNQKYGLDPNNIDYSHPRIIDESETLPPLEVNDGELAKKYLKLYENQIIEAEKNHAEIMKELRLLPKYIEQVIEITEKRVATYEEPCYELDSYDKEILQLGYKTKQREYARSLSAQINKIKLLLKE